MIKIVSQQLGDASSSSTTTAVVPPSPMPRVGRRRTETSGTERGLPNTAHNTPLPSMGTISKPVREWRSPDKYSDDSKPSSNHYSSERSAAARAVPSPILAKQPPATDNATATTDATTIRAPPVDRKEHSGGSSSPPASPEPFRVSHSSQHDTKSFQDVTAQALADTLIDALVVADWQGKIIEFNDAATKMFGYSHEEIIGHNVSILMPSMYRADHPGFMTRCESGVPPHLVGIHRRLQGCRKGGSWFPVDISLGASSSGFYAATFRDATSNERLLQSRAERYKNDFEQLELLGAGGFGCVYRVRNRLDGQEYAVKQIRLDENIHVGDAASEHALSLDCNVEDCMAKTLLKVPTNCRNLREVAVLAKLPRHPCVVCYHNAWVENVYLTDTESVQSKNQGKEESGDESTARNANCGSNANADGDVPSSQGLRAPHAIPRRQPVLFIQMQLVSDSICLGEWLFKRDEGDMIVDDRANLKILRQILRGLRHIHKHNYVHRDIKVVASEGNKELVLGKTAMAGIVVKEDFNKLTTECEDQQPCFFLFKQDTSGRTKGDWVFVAYIPDAARVADKMVFATSENSFKSKLAEQLDGAGFAKTFHASHKSEITYFNLQSSQEKSRSDEELSTAERARKELDRAEEQARQEYKEKMTMRGGGGGGIAGAFNAAGVGSRVGGGGASDLQKIRAVKQEGKALTGFHTVSYPLAAGDVDTVKALLDGGGSDINWIKVTVDEKACVMNVAESLNVAVKDLAAAVDTKRAAFYIYKHVMGGSASGPSVVFLIYCCPDECPPKERVAYSTCKSNVATTLKNQVGIHIGHLLDIRENTELTEQLIRDTITPPRHNFSSSSSSRVGEALGTLQQQQQRQRQGGPVNPYHTGPSSGKKIVRPPPGAYQ